MTESTTLSPRTIVLTFTITLEQPVLLGRIGAGEENSQQSFDYIPGSVIRGMLIHAYQRQHGAQVILPDSEPWSLFFDEQSVAFLNAYPLDQEGKRTLPCPRTWRMSKDDVDEHNALIADLASPFASYPDTPQAPKRPFVEIKAAAASEDTDDGDPIATFYQPQLSINVHNASTQRFVKKEGDSTVFRYDALAAGQQFGGVILIYPQAADGEVKGDMLQNLLARQGFHIGGSQSAGYGRIQIDVIKTESGWSEYTPMAIAPNTVIVTLLSDTVLRNEEGRWHTDLALQLEQLGVEQQPKFCFLATDVTGGFNRTWGLPIPQMPILRAGSVLVFHDLESTAHSALITKLTDLAKTGIGERRNEGFGRLAVNWHGVSQLIYQKPGKGQADTPLTLIGDSEAMAKTMVERLYRAMLDRRLMEIVNHTNMTINGPIENNQLAQLRIIARQALDENRAEVVTSFVKKLRKPARQQYQAAKIDGISLERWLNEGWTNEALWKKQFTIDDARRPRIGIVSAIDTPALKLEYMVRLVDALCKKTVRLNQQQPEEAAQ